MVRVFIRDNEGVYFPDEVADALQEVLDPIAPHWWGEVVEEELYEWWQTSGSVYERIWLDEKDYNEHRDWDFVVDLGFYVPAPRFRGTWYYYYDKERIKKEIQKKLQEIGVLKQEKKEEVKA